MSLWVVITQDTYQRVDDDQEAGIDVLVRGSQDNSQGQDTGSSAGILVDYFVCCPVGRCGGAKRQTAGDYYWARIWPIE